jgi:two-component system chemotaxis response regulator CheB
MKTSQKTKTPCRVLIVDDSALMRQILTHVLQSDKDIEVIGSAVDPYDARQKIKELNPDVLTLDVEMPHMDGITFLEKIMTLRPMPVVMVSTLTQKGAEITLQALEIGAVDFVGKPEQATPEAWQRIGQELCGKVKAAASANLILPKRPVRPRSSSAASQLPEPELSQRIIAIGASTGGVEALREIFSMVEKGLPPIVVTQHMPAAFTSSFAQRLNSLCALPVSEARHGEQLQPNHIYIAPGHAHLLVEYRSGKLVSRLDDGAPVSGHRPSVDCLFHSVAALPDNVCKIGVLLTGMGKDGAEGLLALRRKGYHTIAQDEASCVVYGMPRAAMALGAVEKQVTLGRIAPLMHKLSLREPSSLTAVKG